MSKVLLLLVVAGLIGCATASPAQMARWQCMAWGAKPGTAPFAVCMAARLADDRDPQ